MSFFISPFQWTTLFFAFICPSIDSGVRTRQTLPFAPCFFNHGQRREDFGMLFHFPSIVLFLASLDCGGFDF
jgi:hypothetical protein